MIRLHWNGVDYTTFPIETAITFRSNIRFQWFKVQKASMLCAEATRAIINKNKDVSIEISTKLRSSYVFIVKLSTDIKNLIRTCYILLSTLESCAIDRALNSKRVCKKKHWKLTFFHWENQFYDTLALKWCWLHNFSHWNSHNFSKQCPFSMIQSAESIYALRWSDSCNNQ